MTFSLASKGATFKRFAKYSSNEQITLQGFPTATLPEGISCVTVEPAPIIQLSPIFTPLSTVTFAPK